MVEFGVVIGVVVASPLMRKLRRVCSCDWGYSSEIGLLMRSTYGRPSLEEHSIDIFFPAIFQALFTSRLP